MKVLTTMLMLWLFGFTTRQAIARKGDIALKCLHDLITVEITDIKELARSLNSTAFFVGYPLCAVNQADGKIKLYFPFQLCGTRFRLAGDGVILSNTLWASHDILGPIKYADVICRYGSHFEKSKAPKAVALNQPPTGVVRPEVGLCNTPVYCPSYACHPSRALTNHAIYFEHDVMHLSIRLAGMDIARPGQDKVAAIGNLSISCGTNRSRSAEDYSSVSDGCAIYFGRSLEILRTLVDYNVQTDTICLSVDAPPTKGCSTYYLHGTAIYCNRTYEKKCDNDSGSKCDSPDAEKIEFVYGPIYVLPRNKTDAEVVYHLEPARTTMSAYLATRPDEDFLAGNQGRQKPKVLRPNPAVDSGSSETGGFKEYAEQLDMDGPGARSPNQGANARRSEIAPWLRMDLPLNTATDHEPAVQVALPSDILQDIDLDQNIAPRTPQNTAIPLELKRPRTAHPNRRKAHYLIDLEQIAEEKALDDPNFENKFPIERGTNNFSEADIAPAKDGELKVLSTRRLNSKKNSSKSRNRKTFSKNVGQIKGALSAHSSEESESIVSDRAFDLNIQKSNREIVKSEGKSDGNEIPFEDAAPKNNSMDSVRKEVPSITPLESSLGEPPLGRFNSASANEGFIWGSVAAIGVFLLASVGLLAAWIATRRKKAHRRISRRNM